MVIVLKSKVAIGVGCKFSTHTYACGNSMSAKAALHNKKIIV